MALIHTVNKKKGVPLIVSRVGNEFDCSFSEERTFNGNMGQYLTHKNPSNASIFVNDSYLADQTKSDSLI
jgi:hypothetical protein